MNTSLPSGQRESRYFQRFGLPTFAFRFPTDNELNFEVRGDVEHVIHVTREMLARLPHIDQHSDFHCVTTWSVRNQCWGGVRFSDFYEQCVVALAKPLPSATLVVFRDCDRYVTSLPLEDLLRSDVLLADHLNGSPLELEHGAPLRLVAPAHYGYKNVKHIVAIEFWRDRKAYRFPLPYPSLMEHPRGRVASEERGKIFPPWVFRMLYRPLIGPITWLFRIALRQHRR